MDLENGLLSNATQINSKYQQIFCNVFISISHQSAFKATVPVTQLRRDTNYFSNPAPNINTNKIIWYDPEMAI